MSDEPRFRVPDLPLAPPSDLQAAVLRLVRDGDCIGAGLRGNKPLAAHPLDLAGLRDGLPAQLPKVFRHVSPSEPLFTGATPNEIYCISTRYTIDVRGCFSHLFPIYSKVMKPKKQGRGRPRKSSGKLKSKVMLVRLEPAERQAFDEAAELAGLPLAAWVRERLRAASRKELIESGRQVPFIQSAIGESHGEHSG
jgi:hypothetical protein